MHVYYIDMSKPHFNAHSCLPFLITYMYQHSAHKWYFNVITYLLLQIARNTTVTNLYVYKLSLYPEVLAAQIFYQ